MVCLHRTTRFRASAPWVWYSFALIQEVLMRRLLAQLLPAVLRIAVLGCSIASFPPCLLGQQPIDLGLPGDVSSYASAVNGAGMVVGGSGNSAFSYASGVLQ